MKARIPELIIVVCMAALAPLLFLQALHLWERPHFQFFPISWLACAGLVYWRAEIQPAVGLIRNRLGTLIWGLGVLLGVVAAAFFSPWLGQAAAIVCLTGWGCLRLGGVLAAVWISWTLLLWITLPLPGQYDAEVVGGLQRLSAESAGSLLDLIGIAHLRQGTLLEIRSGKLFVDEACSGIDSFYSLAAITLLMILWQERPFIVGLFTLATVPVWAWLGNVVRLTVIVVLLDRWQIDLSSGWPHTALGFVTFGMSSLFLLATLSGFSMLFRRFSMSDLPRERLWHLRYNAIVCYPATAPAIVDDTDQYFVSSRSSTPPDPKPTTTTAPVALSINWPLIAVVGVLCMGMLGWNIRNISRDWMDGRSNLLPHYELNQVSNAFHEEGFPEKLGQAQRMQFNSEQRQPDNFLGEYSRSWLYRDSVCDFVLAIDFPFRGYHPLEVCYTNAGNKLLQPPSPVKLASENGASAEKSYVQHAKFRDGIGNYSYLWFVLMQHDGQFVPVHSYEKAEDENAMLARLKTVLADTVQRDPVSYQFQMFVPSGRQLSPSELSDYQNLFESALPMARQQIKQLPQ